MGTIDNTAALIKAAREWESELLTGELTSNPLLKTHRVRERLSAILALAAIEQQPTSVMGTIDENGLKNCPFCGSAARYKCEGYYPARHYAKHTVSCTKCLAGSIIADTKEGVISDWNTRVSDSPKQPDSSGEDEGLKLRDFDAANYLDTGERVEAYLNAVFDEDGDDKEFVRQAFRDAAKAFDNVSKTTAERLLAGVDVEVVAKDIADVPFGSRKSTDETMHVGKKTAAEMAQAAIASIKRQLDKQGVK